MPCAAVAIPDPPVDRVGTGYAVLAQHEPVHVCVALVRSTARIIERSEDSTAKFTLVGTRQVDQFPFWFADYTSHVAGSVVGRNAVEAPSHCVLVENGLHCHPQRATPELPSVTMSLRQTHVSAWRLCAAVPQ